MLVCTTPLSPEPVAEIGLAEAEKVNVSAPTAFTCSCAALAVACAALAAAAAAAAAALEPPLAIVDPSC